MTWVQNAPKPNKENISYPQHNERGKEGVHLYTRPPLPSYMTRFISRLLLPLSHPIWCLHMFDSATVSHQGNMRPFFALKLIDGRIKCLKKRGRTLKGVVPTPFSIRGLTSC